MRFISDTFSKLKQITFGFLFLGAAIFLLISLGSYSEHDPSFNQATTATKINNLAGYYGAYVADPMLQALGLANAFLIAFFAIAGIKIFFGAKLRYFLWRLWAVPLILPIISLTFALIDINIKQPSIYTGGFIGIFLRTELLHYIDEISLLFYAAFLASIGILLGLGITAKEWQSIVMAVTQYCIRTLQLTWWLTNIVYIALTKFITKLKGEDENNAPEPNFPEMPKPIEVTPLIMKKTPLARNKSVTQPKLLLEHDDYNLPNADLLQPTPPQGRSIISRDALQQNSKLLQNVLQDFGIKGDIVQINPGPVVTLYELEPAAGTKSSRVIGLADDISRSMSAISARISVIPGKNALGIELPNSQREIVYMRELLESTEYNQVTAKLPLILGKDICGAPIVADLAKMPHLLVAGTTGSGKSVAINTMILSLLYKYSPKQCRFIMIDPKMLELSVYADIPHLLVPVVTEAKKAVTALKWVVKEMEIRYRAMSLMGVRNIQGYNQMVINANQNQQKLEKRVQVGFSTQTGEPLFETITLAEEPLPYIVVIVDEMADLMLVAGKDIEGYIQRLAQMARAAGIHLIMATQRPSVDVITGVIKANFPTRISFQVTSKIDSRTILGEQGAEQLLGMGDMLYMAGAAKITRVHGPFVSDQEVERIVNFIKSQGQPDYTEDIDRMEAEDIAAEEYGDQMSLGENPEGDLYQQAVTIIKRDKRISTSYIQRMLKIGYNRAATLIERMEKDGIITPPNHQGKRELIGSEDD